MHDKLDCIFSSAWSVLFFRFWGNRCKTLRKREIEKDKEREGRQNHMCKCDEYPSSSIIFPSSNPLPVHNSQFFGSVLAPKIGV